MSSIPFAGDVPFLLLHALLIARCCHCHSLRFAFFQAILLGFPHLFTSTLFITTNCLPIEADDNFQSVLDLSYELVFPTVEELFENHIGQLGQEKVYIHRIAATILPLS